MGGEITVEQEACSKAAAAGIAKFSTKHTSFFSSSTGQQSNVTTFASDGAERLMEAWGRAINTASISTRSILEEVKESAVARSHPGMAMVDVIVVQAMLQSRGGRVQIT